LEIYPEWRPLLIAVDKLVDEGDENFRFVWKRPTEVNIILACTPKLLEGIRPEGQKDEKRKQLFCSIPAEGSLGGMPQ